MIEKFLSSFSLSINPTIVVLLTVLPVIFYAIYTIVQFTKTDKSITQLGGDVTVKGLSRFCTAGIYVLFGFILFSLIIEFLTAYFINVEVKLSTDSQILSMIISAYRGLPIELLVNGTIFCIALYTGTEGFIAGIKTLNISAGMCVELPYIKRKRLSSMFFIWCFLSVISTVYHVIVGSDEVNFCVSNMYVGLIVDLAILFLAERTPTILENKTTKDFESKVIKSAANVVSDSIGPAVDIKTTSSSDSATAVDEK